MAKKTTTKKAVAKKAKGNTSVDTVPDYMKNKAGKGHEAIGSEDVEIPRVQLLQSVSEEVQEGDETAGNFYHSLAEQSLGDDLVIIPLFIDKRFILWRPRHDGGGILARADDGVHWNIPDGEFDVQLYKGNKKRGIWKTADTVRASGLAEWGTYDPEDPNSPPAATRMFNVVCFLPDFPEFSPCVVTLQRSSIKVGRKFLGKLKLLAAPSFGTRFKMTTVIDINNDGEKFFNYKFTGDGFVADEAEFAVYEELYESFARMGVNIRDIEGAQEADVSGGGDDDGDGDY